MTKTIRKTQKFLHLQQAFAPLQTFFPICLFLVNLSLKFKVFGVRKYEKKFKKGIDGTRTQ